MFHVSTPNFLFNFFNFFKIFYFHLCHRSRQYHVTCQVSIVTHVKSLFESQFGPYICYFYFISVLKFIKKISISSFQIETKFKFYMNVIMILLLKVIFLLIF